MKKYEDFKNTTFPGWLSRFLSGTLGVVIAFTIIAASLYTSLFASIVVNRLADQLSVGVTTLAALVGAAPVGKWVAEKTYKLIAKVFPQAQ